MSASTPPPTSTTPPSWPSSDGAARPPASFPPNPALRAASGCPRWFPPLFYGVLAALFLWRSTFAGEIFLPAGLLGHVAPYAAHTAFHSLPPWNPLRWDSIAQFYPWRAFAARTLHAGTLPLWNPYQFCGTPFVANSQSAVFYPLNLLFTLIPTARAFGLSALLHLSLCGWFTYLLLRGLGRSHGAALLGGVVYAYSAWQVAWLQLPTFLATSCWFPLLLRQIHRLIFLPTPTASTVSTASTQGAQGDAPRQPAHRARAAHLRPAAALGGVVGMMLLAGHLQIAFYGLLAGGGWALALLIAYSQHRDPEPGQTVRGATGRRLTACVGGLVLGLMLAAPQLLPTLELSRLSHRVGSPTPEGYHLYTEYALPLAGLVTLTLPDFFGNDHDADNPYWGFYVKMLPNDALFAVRHNAAETAVYIGIGPLLLGLFALWRASATVVRRKNTALGTQDTPVLLFFGGLALLSLLLALGTPLNGLFYFGVPGFGQSGSPARSLVLWALAWAALSSSGLDALLQRPPTGREIAATLGTLLFVFAISLSLAARAIADKLPGFDALQTPLLGDAFGRLGTDWVRLAFLTAGGTLLLLLPNRLRSLRSKPAGRTSFSPALPIVAWALLLGIGDLFSVGFQNNPTSPLEQVYPETPGIAVLRQYVGHERIFPVNRRWSLIQPPPAVLPPNGAMVYGLRDVQGYDSLFTGQYKAFANQFARPTRFGTRDASPPEVGNMVFFQNPNADRSLAASVAAAVIVMPPLSSPGFTPEAIPIGLENLSLYADEMTIYPMPHTRPRIRLGSQSVADSASPEAVSPNAVWKEDGPTRLTIETTIKPATEKTATKQMATKQTATEQTATEQTATEQTATEKTATKQTATEQTATKQTATGTKTVATTAPGTDPGSPLWLFLQDQFYPGWHAAVDGKPVPIDRQPNAPIFRMVLVPAGHHTVMFRYEPTSFRVGLYLACLACFLIALLTTVSSPRLARLRPTL